MGRARREGTRLGHDARGPGKRGVDAPASARTAHVSATWRRLARGFWIHWPITLVLMGAQGVHNPQAFAQGEARDRERELPEALYYDADEIQISQESGDITAEGNVFFLVGDLFISADKIVYLRQKRLLTAEGDVRIVRKQERILASRVVFDEATREARMENVQIIADPAITDKQLNDELLGFSDAELAFETSRSERTVEITRELRLLRDQYVTLRNVARARRGAAGPERSELDRVVRRYSQLLERMARTRFQPNRVLETLPDEKREQIERRREAARTFAARNPTTAERLVGFKRVPGYVRVRAESIYQNPEGNYEITNATITPCNCTKDDGTEGTPLWGFSAREAVAEPEQYVTLYGSTLDIWDVPVVYSPWLKFPIKTKRQTGFLLPAAYTSRAGEAVAVPFYVTMGEHADATLTYNHFSSRGSRFDAEGRVQLTPDSRIRGYGEWIQDKRYEKDFEANRKEVEAQIAQRKADAAARNPDGTPKAPPLTSEEETQLREQIGRDRASRWYAQGSWNIPLTAQGSIKTDGETVSDNRYLSDFSKDIGPTQDLFAPKKSDRRFLGQEAAAEYYGDDVTLSLRAQGQRDLFAARSSDTPVRLPRVEFELLPKRYFDLPLSFDATGQWERVHRLDGSGFLDLPNANAVTQASELRAKTSPYTVAPNQRKDPDEPYVEGDRTHLQARLELPLPANDYINASASVRGVSTTYAFPQVANTSETRGQQSYVAYEAAANVPFYTELTLSNLDRTPYATLRNDIVPSITFRDIPSVERTADYPKTYQLWYKGDDVFSTQELVLSLASDFVLTRETLEQQPIELPRLEPKADPGVGNQAIFEDVLDERRVEIETTPESIFALSGAAESPQLFRTWAERELTAYEQRVREAEFDKPFVWPGQTAFRKNVLWSMRPLSLRVSTAYNFRPERTAQERNERRRPGDPQAPVQQWGDIAAQANWSIAPVLPLYGGVGGTWSRVWDRLRDGNASVGANFGFGLSAAVSNSFVVTEAEPGKRYPRDRVVATDVSYLPFGWLRLQFQHSRKLNKERDVTPTDPEKEYSNLQRISFLKIQDCLDITLQRFKDYDVREYQATWTIGLNLQFFGQSTQIDNIGSSLDRAIKDRNARERNSTTGS